MFPALIEKLVRHEDLTTDEAAQAMREVMRLAKEVADDTVILVNLSGRGDKDVQSVIEALR